MSTLKYLEPPYLVTYLVLHRNQKGRTMRALRQAKGRGRNLRLESLVNFNLYSRTRLEVVTVSSRVRHNQL